MAQKILNFRSSLNSFQRNRLVEHHLPSTLDKRAWDLLISRKLGETLPRISNEQRRDFETLLL